MQEHHENLCSVKGIDSTVGDSFSRDSHLGGWVSSTISTIVSPNKEIHIISYIYIYMSSFHICVSLAVKNCLLQISVANHQSHETLQTLGGKSVGWCLYFTWLYTFATPIFDSWATKSRTKHTMVIGQVHSIIFSVYCFEEKTHTTFSSKDIQLKIPCFASSTIICLVLLKSPIDKTPNISFNAEFQFGFLSMDFCCANLLRFTYWAKTKFPSFWISSFHMWKGECRVCLLFSVCHFFKKNIKWINVYLVLAHVKIYESNKVIPLDKGESTKYPKSLPCHPSISL